MMGTRVGEETVVDVQHGGCGVLKRKISGGSVSAEGANAYAVLLTVYVKGARGDVDKTHADGVGKSLRILIYNILFSLK